MSFGVSFRVDVRPYTGYQDPSLPIAAWISQAGVAGDASGGQINLDFLFQRDDDAQVSELFNLEQVSFDNTSTSAVIVLVETMNLDSLSQNRPASPQFWSFTTLGVPATGFSAVKLDNGSQLPLWLGAPNRDEGDVGIRLNFANVDLRLYAVTLQGYMWGPRSVLAEGGPRRPPSGLFGRS